MNNIKKTNSYSDEGNNSLLLCPMCRRLLTEEIDLLEFNYELIHQQCYEFRLTTEERASYGEGRFFKGKK